MWELYSERDRPRVSWFVDSRVSASLFVAGSQHSIFSSCMGIEFDPRPPTVTCVLFACTSLKFLLVRSCPQRGVLAQV